MTTGGGCPTDGELADYIGGRLAPDLEVAVREHCDACASCRGALVALASATTGSGGPPPSLSSGRYRVLRVLGEGGMGVVYEALDDRLGRVVAIKTLHPRTQDDAELAEDRARFAREIQAIARLRSPHVVQILDVVSEPDGSSGFVMERLDGEPLRSLLARERRLPVARALTIAEQILDALSVAHDAGLVHRDVKPENVFLVRSAAGDLVKLLDFGLAKPTRLSEHEVSITGRPMLLGTVAYMAPEQARGERATPAVDVYAAGTILFEMVSGERPYAGASGDVLAAKLLGGERRTLASLAPTAPAAVTALVERLLGAAPEDRPSARDALAELVAARASLPADRSSARLAARAPSPVRVAPAAPAPRVAAVPARRPPPPAASSAARIFVFALVGTALVGGGALAAGLALGGGGAVSPPALDASALSTPDVALAEDGGAPEAQPPPSSSASAPAASASAAASPFKSSCVCVHDRGNGRGFHLCAKPLPPVCVCRSTTVNQLCKVQYTADGKCAGGGVDYAVPTSKTGDYCEGFSLVRSPSGAVVPRALDHGRLECDVCPSDRRPPASRAIPGTPCSGVDHTAAVYDGAWVCP